MKIQFLALCALFVSCGGAASDGRLAVLDLEAAIDNPRTFDVTEIADNLEFIPLDDSDPRSLIDDRIIGLAESQSGWYVHDAVFKPIKMFDKTGEFIGTRGAIGRGPNETIAINGLAVDYETDRVWMTGVNSIIAYDGNGDMTARNDSILCFAMEWFADRLVVIEEDPRSQFRSTETTQPSKNSTTAILDLYSADLRHQGDIKTRTKGTHYIVTYNSSGGEITDVSVMGSPNILSGNGGTLSLKEGRSDTVYHFLDGERLEPAFKLDAGRYTPPAEAFGTNPPVDWSKYWRVVDLWEGDRFVVIAAQKALETELHYLVVDREKPSDGVMAVGPDGRTDFLIDGVSFTPCYIRGNRLVGYMQALDITDNAESMTNPELRAIAETIEEGSNPVMVVATLGR